MFTVLFILNQRLGRGYWIKYRIVPCTGISLSSLIIFIESKLRVGANLVAQDSSGSIIWQQPGCQPTNHRTSACNEQEQRDVLFQATIDKLCGHGSQSSSSGQHAHRGSSDMSGKALHCKNMSCTALNDLFFPHNTNKYDIRVEGQQTLILVEENDSG